MPPPAPPPAESPSPNLQHAAGSDVLKVLIADDHELLRDMLSMFLTEEQGFDTRTVPDLAATKDVLAADPEIDIVLLDYAMPGMNGLAGFEEVRDLPGKHRVAIISGTATREVAQQALDSGAAGFLPKTLSAKSLVNAVRFMAMGEQYAPREFLTTDPVFASDHPLAELLSKREMEVLHGLTQGKSNKEIARDLDIREPTVKLHVKTLYRKLGVANRTQAAMTARSEGLF